MFSSRILARRLAASIGKPVARSATTARAVCTTVSRSPATARGQNGVVRGQPPQSTYSCQHLFHTARTVSQQQQQQQQEQQKSPYLHTSSTPLPPHPVTIDQPYPPIPEDSHYTISFYSFFPLTTEQATNLRDQLQNEWSEKLGIVGRIYICEQGINAQLSIPVENTLELRQWLESHDNFRGRIPKFNWALEHRRAFKALHVRMRPLVSTGTPLTLQDLENEPEYLDPEQWDKELRENNPQLIDMRNSYEYRIGRFSGAVCPDVDTFREELSVVRDLCHEDKKKPIYMYCTGGIRCSVAGAVLKSEGYENIKTLRGGVIAYGRHVREAEQGREKSLFRGKNFTFDKRLGEQVTQEVLAKCDQCGEPHDVFTNCANRSCNLLFIQCPKCAEKHEHTCGTDLCRQRAKMPHEELIKNRMPSMWSYSLRVRPQKVFDENGIARFPDEQKNES
ncbi:hypothetical protein GGI07_003171 [Coemansia sp. Benny D115]|nr:hypothetical protein GGI07_003171 [Coemansia sp. Benny D115]